MLVNKDFKLQKERPYLYNVFMLTIVCGEDTVTSRKYFESLRKKYSAQMTEVRDIQPGDIKEILTWMGESTSLFSSKQVFFTNNLESIIVRRRGKKSTKTKSPLTFEETVEEIARKADIELIDWESKSGRDIKMKSVADVKEFKPSSTVFKLLDCCYPGNKKEFITVLRALLADQDENFLFIMLYRHIRTLIAAYDSSFTKTTAPWQRPKLSSQARLWSQNKLIEFYQGLYRLETTAKSGTNPYGIRRTLEILACYYL